MQVGAERLLIKGVTYGTFAPDPDGYQFPCLARVRQDFAMMRAAGINTVRVYTPPRRDLMDAASDAGLRVMVGVPWSQHVAFLDDRRLAASIRRDVAASVAELGDHPALLLFALGNEIPPSVVRWHGAKRVERYLAALFAAARDKAPDALFTYVNFPPTDYLDLPFVDICAFNVYLHHSDALRSYLARLQQIAGLKPLLLAEAGADSTREGPEGQAALTSMNLRGAFAEGACGSIAFAWTDEWWRGGFDVDDWAFGLVDRDRQPKPALAAVSTVFAEAPFSAEVRAAWPRVSVVVCAYNAADTIDDCMKSLGCLTYPDHEVIVVDDGSKDETAAIVARYGWAKLVRIPNGGLSAARNVGLREATGEIVAYTDADVRVDPDWLTYLVQPFVTSDVVGSGGPNLIPPDDPWLAQCVALAPGAPTHVLLDDRIAEHVPGCNMAFRRAALAEVGGFNPLYLRAGDDVDLCWRLQARGGRIGFAPAALVWHHHRSRVKAYWRQQMGYGEGEVWLKPHHPDKFAGLQMIWHGRIYSSLPFVRPLARRRVHTGVWGTASFPSVYHVGANPWAFLVHSSPWQIGSLVALTLGLLYYEAAGPRPLALLLSVLGVGGLAATVGRCLLCAHESNIEGLPPVPGLPRVASRLVYRLTIAWLHLIQPFARLRGRMRGRLTPPEEIGGVGQTPPPSTRPTFRGAARAALLVCGTLVERRYWSERWTSSGAALTGLLGRMQATRGVSHVTSDDGWHEDRDLSVTAGRWTRLDVRVLVEEHHAGKCLVRVAERLRPTALGTFVLSTALALLVVLSLVGHVGSLPSVATGTAIVGLVLLAWVYWRALRTTMAFDRALKGFITQAEYLPLERGRSSVQLAGRAGLQAVTIALAATLALAQTGAAALRAVEARLRKAPLQAASATPGGATRLGLPGGLAIAPNGDVYVASSVTDTIRRLRSGALLRPVVQGSSDRGGTTVARFDNPGGLAIGPDGDIYIADSQNHRVCRLDRSSGVIVTVAGVGVPGFSGDGGPAGTAMLNTPRAVAFGPKGDLFIADTRNNRIRMVDQRTGFITTVAGNGQASGPDGVRDGSPATLAYLDWPNDIALTRRGDFYIADMRHNRVRRVDARTGLISTVAGNGTFGSRGDGGQATDASLAGPSGIALGTPVQGGPITLYISDYFNNCVRVVYPNGVINVLPGAKAMPVGTPSRLAYHPGGWLYVSDTDRDRVTALPLQPDRRAVAPRRPPVKTAT